MLCLQRSIADRFNDELNVGGQGPDDAVPRIMGSIAASDVDAGDIAEQLGQRL